MPAQTTSGNVPDQVYDQVLTRFARRFSAVIGAGARLFTTDARDLFQTYLTSFPERDRQHHNCSCCRKFIERFGGLVTIAPDGATRTPIWTEDDVPTVYQTAFAALASVVRRAQVTGVYLSPDRVWGTPITGSWTHLNVTPDPSMLFVKGGVLTAGQVMAERREDFKAVCRALAEFTTDHLEQALKLLDTDSLYRSEKLAGPVRWLRNLHAAQRAAPKDRKSNVVWLAVATAPSGFCHPRSSMAGTLLDDIAAGMSFDDVSRRFAAKMHPLQYQRPQAAPTAGNIAQGEKIIAAMGAERSLLRRFARLDEIEVVWSSKKPPAKPQATRGVFDHLTPKGKTVAADMDIPAVTMTWEKFQRTVLPVANEIEFFARPNKDNYGAMLTAVDPAAPPILQWDSADQRNPVSWYVWVGGSTPESFSLVAGTWHKLSAISLKPSMWYGGKFAHQGNGLMLVIADARETKQSGLALFPEFLKAELHGIRATIEAYSKKGQLDGIADGNVCGLLLTSGGTWNALVRVTIAGRVTPYQLDRWD